MLENLPSFDDPRAKKIVSMLLTDGDSHVRLRAARAVSSLKDGNRVDVWRETISSQDPLVRLLGIEQIGSLPRGERSQAWRVALNSWQSVTAEVTTQQVINAPDSVKKTVGTYSEILLVDQIASLPIGQRFTAWSQAYNNSATRYAAIQRMTVLPTGDIAKAWHMAWNAEAQRASYSDRNHCHTLAEHIARLPQDARMTAWNSILESGTRITGEGLSVALESLPDRPSQWQRLAALSREGKLSVAVLADTVRGLAPGERMNAFNHLVTEFAVRDADGVTRAIEHLPEGQRLEQFGRLLKQHPNEALTNQVCFIPAADLPRAVELIGQHDQPALRVSMLENLPVERIHLLPVEQALNLSENLFRQAEKMPDGEQAMRLWWQRLNYQPENQTGYVA
ncbi:MAG: hypothetical protein K2Z81_24625, partial [Cyanobacteria bacterium]|nr:hypothetical protein [Cyanobacteriota bacterium]